MISAFSRIEATVYIGLQWVEGTAIQIEKALIDDPLRASKASWKFRIPTVYNFAVISSWSLLFS